MGQAEPGVWTINEGGLIMSKGKWSATILTGIILCFGFEDRAQARDEIILKTMIVNPSATKTQKAILKSYLPKEIEPEDVIDMEDLRINYDISQELYYVYKEVNLKPGEKIVRSITLKDVWTIANEEIDSFINKGKRLTVKLENTIYFKAANELQELIETKCRLILDQQFQTQDAFPQVYIASYRQNMIIIDEIKDSLVKLTEIISEAGVTDVDGRQTKAFASVTWWVILAVIIFLGVISLIFFFVWQHQAKISKTESEE